MFFFPGNHASDTHLITDKKMWSGSLNKNTYKILDFRAHSSLPTVTTGNSNETLICASFTIFRLLDLIISGFLDTCGFLNHVSTIQHLLFR